MIPHLHVHLEPEVRKRALLGLRRRTYTSDQQFFAAHHPDDKDRIPVSATDLESFLIQLHSEQHAQGLDYVELRLSPRRFINDGMRWSSFLEIVERVVSEFRQPLVRVILLLNRDSSDSLIDKFHSVIRDELPSSFVGLDIAGDERLCPDISRFHSLFEIARERLGITVHAGEFGTVADVWRAVDELGAQRIGHGLTAVSSSSLIDRLARDGILVEVSLWSNFIIGAADRSSPHPVVSLLERGVPISFNTDIPLHIGRNFCDEIHLAMKVLRMTRDEVLDIQRQAMRFSFSQY